MTNEERKLAKEKLIKSIETCLSYLGFLIPEDNTLIAIQGEVSNLKRQEMLGLMSFDQITLSKNQMRERLLNFIDQNADDMGNKLVIKGNGNFVIQGTDSEIQKEQVMFKNQVTLDNLFSNPVFKRTDEVNYNKVVELRNQIRNYEDQKKQDSLYDVSERVKSMIQVAIDSFLDSYTEKILDTKEDFAADINKALGQSIPSWKTIEQYYNLCVGRGMNNTSLEKAIKAAPKDDVSKVSAAETIISWVKNYLS